MKRLALAFLLLSCFAAGVPTAFGQSCATPPPTYTPTPGYRATVQAVSPGNLLVYFPLNETSGTTAEDDSGNNADGTYSGVTLNATTFLTGDPAGSWDGINDYVSFWTTYLQTNWSSAEGTAMVWAQVPSSVWTDATVRFFVNFVADVNNLWRIRKLASNQMQWAFLANAINRQVMASISPTVWTQYVLVWTAAGNHIAAYRDGALVATVNAPGVWANATLNPTQVAIGAASSSGTNPMLGNIAEVAVWKHALDATQVAQLATIDPVLTIPPTATMCPSWTPTITPSHTPTYTPTPTHTPNPYLYWQLPIPNGTALPDATGTPTPVPGQWVRFDYTASAGQIGIIFFLAIILIAVLCMWLILVIRRDKKRKASNKPLTDNRSN